MCPGDSLEKQECRSGERRVSASGREIPAVCKELSCVLRGPEECRRVIVVLEAAPRRLSSGGDSCGKIAESGEEALRKPFGGVGGGVPVLSPESARAA